MAPIRFRASYATVSFAVFCADLSQFFVPLLGVLLMHPQNTASHASYSSSEIILGHSDLNIIKHYAKVDIENLRLCDLDPPRPKVIFADYLSGKKVVRHV